MDLPVTGPSSLAYAAPSAAPFVLLRPARQSAPLVFASPHSGRDYPADFIASARLDPIELRRSEDSFVDELFAAAPSLGAPLLAATFPRAFCDPNREPFELDPEMFEDELPTWVNTKSPRVGAGLGTIARIVSSGESIYRGRLRFAEAERRVRQYWEPFHAALAELIVATHAQFGATLLIDCHSMPAGCCGAPPHADFVLGDVHGTACHPDVTRRIKRLLARRGYAVRRNDPYAGGYITRHYGRPRDHMHAVQVEISRALYMDEGRIERSRRFAATKADMAELIASLAAEATSLLRQ